MLGAFVIGWVVLARMVPPPAPSAGAEQIKAFFLTDLTSKRIGLALCICVWGLLIPWSIAMGAQTRRAERDFPALTLIQIACATCMAAVGA